MKFSDIEKQGGKWVENCQITVCEVGEVMDNEHGLSQAVEITDSDGNEGVLYVYLKDPVFAVPATDIGVKWYRVKYKDGRFSGYPVPDGVASEDDKWDKISFGKCRHTIVVACIDSIKDVIAINNSETWQK